jgi:hypothetical protein
MAELSGTSTSVMGRKQTSSSIVRNRFKENDILPTAWQTRLARGHKDDLFRCPRQTGISGM